MAIWRDLRAIRGQDRELAGKRRRGKMGIQRFRGAQIAIQGRRTAQVGIIILRNVKDLLAHLIQVVGPHCQLLDGLLAQPDQILRPEWGDFTPRFHLLAYLLKIQGHTPPTNTEQLFDLL